MSKPKDPREAMMPREHKPDIRKGLPINPNPILPGISPIEARMEAKKAVLLKAKEQYLAQLNGIENQLLVIDQLQHPENDPMPGEEEPAPELEPQDTPDGTM